MPFQKNQHKNDIFGGGSMNQSNGPRWERLMRGLKSVPSPCTWITRCIFRRRKQTASVCPEIGAAAAHLPAAPLRTSVGLLLKQRWGAWGDGIDFSTPLITVTSLTNETELFKLFVCKYQDQWLLQLQCVQPKWAWDIYVWRCDWSISCKCDVDLSASVQKPQCLTTLSDKKK